MTAYTLFAGDPTRPQVTSCEVTREDGAVLVRLSLDAVPYAAQGAVRLLLPEPVRFSAGDRVAVWIDQAPGASAFSAATPLLMTAGGELISVFLYGSQGVHAEPEG